uniref:Secreted protein n=1 Tax=Schizaphis graminum TaxID=13262 RepID=A0A2S2NHD8_SCHGA
MMYRRCLLWSMLAAAVPVAELPSADFRLCTSDESAAIVVVVLEAVVAATRQVIAIKHNVGNAWWWITARCCRPMTVAEPKLTEHACAYFIFRGSLCPIVADNVIYLLLLLFKQVFYYIEG